MKLTFAVIVVLITLTSLTLRTSAVPQMPEYQGVQDAFGQELDFVITSTTHHPVSWQRCHGDPHGQVAPAEYPDPRSSDTLSFDFPKAEDGELDLVLWQHRVNNLIIIGTVTDTRLNKVVIRHPEFAVEFKETIIEITEGGVNTTRSYDIPFNYTLPSGGEVGVTGEVLYNAYFRFRSYHFVITKPNGIYNVTGETEFGMSVTRLSGNAANMVGLIGQLSSYDLFMPNNPQLGDQALANVTVINENGSFDHRPLFLVTLTHHLGMYKTCWHYEQGADPTHAVVGDFANFYYEQAPCDVVQRPIRNYPDVYGGSIIYVDFPFQCSGLVTGVQFFAENRLDFYLSAWRPSASGDSWTLIWYTIIVPQRMRAQIYTLPAADQMHVRTSDVIGIFYPEGSPGRTISSKNIPVRQRDGTSSRFLRTMESEVDLTIGDTKFARHLAGNGDTERIIPVNVIIR